MKPNHRAFTLIELLVVILIIGILATVALPQYQQAVAKSRLVQLQVRTDALYKAAQVYFLSNGSYPTDVRLLDIGINTSNAQYGKTSAGTAEHTGILYDGRADGIRCAVLSPARGLILCTDNDFALLIYSDTKERYCRPRKGEGTLADKVCRSMATGPMETKYSQRDYPLN